MSKKTSASSARGKRHAESAKHITDHEIDFSDIPESTPAELASARRVGRPTTGRAKQLIAFRMAPELLGKLRRVAANRHRPYQTVLHEIIESGVSQAALLASAGANSEAFSLILERYSTPVTAFLFACVRDHGLAEELTQETFVRAFRSWKTLHEDTRFSSWLFGIATNVARESRRARARDARSLDLQDNSLRDLSDESPVPVNQLLNKELDKTIQRALASLDEDKRLVFTLKVFQQYSYEEIAEITGFSISKLKTDLHRARAEMRRRISPYLKDTKSD